MGLLAGVVLLTLVWGCDEGEGAGPPPTAAQVAEHYRAVGTFSVEMSGNVAQVTTVIDRDAYRMGGELWARASPYVFLFSAPTQEVFQAYPGLGGVRMIVRYGDGSLVAEALLDRASMPAGRWGRALSIAGQARAEGSERPGYMRDLVRWGEDHTEFRYNPEYIPVP